MQRFCFESSEYSQAASTNDLSHVQPSKQPLRKTFQTNIFGLDPENNTIFSSKELNIKHIWFQVVLFIPKLTF